MKNNKKAVALIIFILIILTAIIIYTIIIKNSTLSTEPIKQIDNIKEYGYTLNNNSTKYQKKLFQDLKNILDKDIVIDEEYAKIISKSFVTDLFTLSNKITNSDVGGTQYVFEDFKEDYIAIAKSGLYNSIKNNIYGNRKQVLPEVTNVEIINVEKKVFKYNNQIFNDSYYINLKIKYSKDLGYPTNYNVVISKNEKFMQVVKSYP